MLHEIIITACLMNSPKFGATEFTQCQAQKDVTIVVDYDAPSLLPSMCQKIGYTEAAKWESEHPGWAARRVRCAPPKKRTQDI